MVTLADSYFALFELPARFALDSQALENAYRAVQAQVHPDKFAHATDGEKRRALQWATHANAAYQTLKKPLARATYLCGLHGVSIEAESNTSMPPAFLMQQMEWREQLEEARASGDLAQLESLDGEVRQFGKQLLAKVTEQIDSQADYGAAAQTVRQWMFIEKMRDEVHAALEVLDV